MYARQKANLADLCGVVRYPHTSYDLEITDLDTGASWSKSCGSITPDVDYQMYAPLSIKHSDTDINPGEMNLTLYIKR